jgi:hypothetical protein
MNRSAKERAKTREAGSILRDVARGLRETGEKLLRSDPKDPRILVLASRFDRAADAFEPERIVASQALRDYARAVRGWRRGKEQRFGATALAMYASDAFGHLCLRLANEDRMRAFGWLP